MNHLRFSSALAFLLLVPAFVSALPAQQRVSDSDQDALVELTVLDEHIRGDNNSWCEIRINIVGTEIAISAGDTVELSVYEDDVVFDDELYTTTFTVTPAEVTAQLVDRRFDCSGDFGSDATPTLELYGRAEVRKSLCRFTCRWDRPTTPNADVTERDDDTSEEDDTMGAATPLMADTPVSRIGVDSDFHEITLVGPNTIELTSFYRPRAGRLNVELLDDAGATLFTAADGPSGASVTSGALTAGTYFVRVAPRAPPDSQFYDLLITLSSTTCATGTMEMRACGMCGMETRSCTGGTWGAYGACMGEGECMADAIDTRVCGVGGIEMRTCGATCMWGSFGACMGEGEDDAGGVVPDAGTTGSDAGVVITDSGTTTGSDSGTTAGTDAGSPTIDSGCSCRSIGGPGSASPFAFALFALMLVWRIRRR